MYMYHHGYKYSKRNKSNNTIVLNDRSNTLLDLGDRIYKEKMNYDIDNEFKPADVGESIVKGFQMLREMLEFVVFTLLLMVGLIVGTLCGLGITGIVTAMGVWDMSKKFWKNIKNT